MQAQLENLGKNRYLITLCICTMNRPDELNRCLESIFQSREKPDEIIVSDDSADGTPTQAIVAKYPDIIYQKGPRRGLAPNRNACISRAKGSHLIFIDDDVCVPPEFFATARQLTATSDAKTIITGYEMNDGGGGRWIGEVRKVIPRNSDFWGFQKVSVSKDYRAIVINATIFPHSLFKQALFDENFRYGCEEIDIARHAVALGYRIVYEDCLFVEHYPSPINREHYQQFINASRLYATTKAYWQYERSMPKTLIYILLAPLYLIAGAIRRGNLPAVWQVIQATGLAGHYIFRRWFKSGAS